MPRLVKIGKHEIEVSDNHIYLRDNLPETYDYAPWNLIAVILKEAERQEASLVDIGANVGDSLAHFRRHSDAPALCIEPDELYFSLLTTNAEKLGNAQLRKSLLVPDYLIGKTAFTSDGQTGSSRLTEDFESAWQGSYFTIADMMHDLKGPTVIKTDTDGFDAKILHGIVPYLNRNFVPIIFFEGPLAVQHQRSEYDDYLVACSSLQRIGYKILLMTNIGLPYAYVGTSTSHLASCFHALTLGYRKQRALCHYYDIIAVHPSISSPSHSLSRMWGEEIFNQV